MNSDSPISTVSQSFRDRADSAAFYESWVCAVLRRCGLYVVLSPFVIDGMDHGLTFDMEVASEDPVCQAGFSDIRRLEVKSVNLSFKDPDSFPYDPVLLCSQNNFLKKWPGKDRLGSDFVTVSRRTGHIVWVPAGTSVTLGHETMDNTRGEVFKSVTVQKSQLRPLKDYVNSFKVNHG